MTPRTSTESAVRLTERQRVSLEWLGLVGSSRRMSLYASRGLASLEKRGLAENVGGRGRAKELVLTEAGRAALESLDAQGRLDVK